MDHLGIILTIWESFENHLGQFGSHLGPFGKHLGPFRNHLGPLGSNFGPFGNHLGPFVSRPRQSVFSQHEYNFKFQETLNLISNLNSNS